MMTNPNKSHFTDEKQEQLLDRESRSLFKALLKLNQPIGKTCSELEQAALAYGKIKRIPPPRLKEWAGEVPGRNLDIVKKWFYAIAIDVLFNHGLNPINIAPPERVATYWAIQRQGQHTVEEAQIKFINDFHISVALQPLVVAAIANVYQREAKF